MEESAVTSDSSTRSSVEAVLHAARAEILSGRWRRGDLVPTRLELAQQFNAGLRTVQLAMARLRDLGFLEVHGRLGTSVCKVLPMDRRHALVFMERWKHSSFIRTLQYAAADVAHARNLDIAQFFTPHDLAEIPPESDLARQMWNYQLGGLMIVSSTILPRLFEQGWPRMPLVTINAIGQSPSVGVDFPGMVEMAIRHLVRRKRRRIAMIVGMWKPSDAEMNLARLKALGASPYSMVLDCDTSRPWTGRYLGRMLVRVARPAPFDGIIITDDNLTEAITQGLADANAKVPGRLEVVTHCNFPLPPPAAVPVTRIGFDCRKILHRSLDLLEAQRRGLSVQEKVLLAAEFEEDS